MTAYQLLQLLSQLLFVLIAGVVTIKALRRPWKANVDTALLFDIVALIVAVSRLDEKVGITPGRLQTGVLDSLLMALPYLLIRMVDDFTELSPTLLRAATGGLVISVIGLLVFAPPYPGIFLLFCVLYFVGFTGYVAVAFVQAARSSNGVTRRRMEAAAAGAMCLALVILLAGIALAIPKFTEVGNVLSNGLALCCGLFFFLGFAPPRWLRRAWQEPEIRAFLGPAAILPRLSDTSAIVQELERGAADSLGVANAVIGLWDSEAGVMRYDISRAPQTYQSDQFLGGRSFITQQAIFSTDVGRDDPINAEHYRARDIRAVIAAPITAGEKRLGVLCLYAAHAPIFAEDDLSLVTLLANQAAVILESRALIDEAARVRAREEAARLKDDFLSAAAHDLKTPLTALVAQAQLMERRARRKPDAPADLVSIECIVQESQRLKRLVLELLDVARVEQGKLVGRRDAVDLVRLVDEACLRSTTDLHHYVLEAPEQLVGEYDGIRIQQMIDNLLENAGKYSPDGGEVRVRISEEGESARITIADPGIGIPAADLAHLFDRFHRGANVNDRNFAGMGLGLFICRGIVDQHGGVIWATSPGAGQGSTFHIVLPIHGTANALPQAGPPDRAEAMTIREFAVEQAS
jgi:signal transduction histidine kinase